MNMNLPLSPSELNEQWGHIPLNRHYMRDLSNPDLALLLRQYIDPHDQDVQDLIMKYDPSLNLQSRLVSFFPSATASKRVEGKPGKMIRKMFPYLLDPTIEYIVDRIKDTLFYNPDDYTIQSSTESEDFVHAYTHPRVRAAGFQTTTMHKSLDNSCMHGDFDYDKHPAYAYGSGDFQIFWMTENSTGHLAARCVARIETKSHGPIYGNTGPAILALEAHLTSEGYLPYGKSKDCSWEGARLLRLDYHRNGYIVPYPDVDINGFDVTEDHLVFCNRHPDIGIPGGDGLVDAHSCYCTCSFCEDEIEYEEDAYSTEDNGDVCYYCYRDYYTTTDQPRGEVHRIEDTVEVQVSHRRTETWLDSEDYVEAYDGTYIPSDSAVHLEDGDIIPDWEDHYEHADGTFHREEEEELEDAPA